MLHNNNYAEYTAIFDVGFAITTVHTVLYIVTFPGQVVTCKFNVHQRLIHSQILP